ncbi:hypothetical protein [Novosphingobium sp.]|uniref:hypothetical protein n=1 Tax=Novosphingobium sp. TaxID=1874826 RepID=UPI003B51EB3A
MTVLRAMLALVALGSATAAQAASDSCMTPAELNATLVYALPSVIDATAQFCRPVLARDGYLASQGAGLSARYRMGQAGAWPVARAAVLKIAGGGLGKFAALLPDGTLQDMASGYVQQFVVQGVHPGDCADIESALALMAPLPPENTAGLIALVVRRVESTNSGKTVVAGKKLRLPLCPIAVPGIDSTDITTNPQPVH